MRISPIQNFAKESRLHNHATYEREEEKNCATPGSRPSWDRILLFLFSLHLTKIKRSRAIVKRSLYSKVMYESPMQMFTPHTLRKIW